MTKYKLLMIAASGLLVCGAFALAGCGDDDDDNDDTGESGDTVVATITVPAGFSATPESIIATFFISSPPAGMPDEIGDSHDTPAIGDGTPYQLVTSQAGLEGDYYLSVAMYVEGGGGGAMPVSGVDYVGAFDVPVTLGPGTGEVNAGELMLELME
jgi:hypothetical protein